MLKKAKKPYEDDETGKGTGAYVERSAGALELRAKVVPDTIPEAPAPPKQATTKEKKKKQEKSLEDAPYASLFGAVASTLFCFPIFGIVAIVYALRVRPRWKRGDESGAYHAAEMAEKFTYASVGVAVIVYGIAGIAYIAWYLFFRKQ